MTRRANRLLILALAVISVTMYYGCSQTDDIVTPVASTTLHLQTQLLPQAPQGMVYQLWVADNQDTISLGRFNYDPDVEVFLNEDGTVRADSNEFFLEADLLQYTSVFVSIERSPGSWYSPGPIMLVDMVTKPDENPIMLVFPETDSLLTTTCRFNMETTTDSNRAANDGAGVWFCNYSVEATGIRDTFEFVSVTFVPDTIDTPPPTPDQCIVTDTAWEDFRPETIPQPVGLWDTIMRQGMSWTHLTVEDCDSPWVYYKVTQTEWTTSDTVFYLWDKFTQDDFGLIDYSDWGWRYKGWVVSPVISDAGASVGTFTPPAWNYQLTGDIPGAEGGLISTGKFSKITQADESNPYSGAYPLRVPPFPGEDFLDNLPNGAAGPLNLMPTDNGNTGTVFITLEPDNFSDTTNFPLLAYIGKIPDSRTAIEPGDGTVNLPMWNRCAVNNPARGFPKITVNISRF